jgi:periplasmic divalent cation tolerance protein
MHIVIFITASGKKEAKRIAEGLLKKRLIACANILEDVSSLFWWKAKVDKAAEALLIVKSKKALLPKIIQCVKSLHSYEVPEIIALPIIGGYKPYLKWIDESLATVQK